MSDLLSITIPKTGPGCVFFACLKQAVISVLGCIPQTAFRVVPRAWFCISGYPLGVPVSGLDMYSVPEPEEH